MRPIEAAVLALAVTVVPSCSFFVDTSDLNSGKSSSSSDGGSSDGGTVDGGAIGCSETITDSFDNGELGALWDAADATGLALTLDTGDVRSPPNALLVTQAVNAGGHAFLTKKAPVGKTACCELSQKTNATNSTLLQMTGMGGNYRIAVNGNSLAEGYYVGGTDPGINRVVGNLPVDGDWHRVRVEAALPSGAGKGTVRVTFDGGLVLSGEIGGDAYDVTFSEIDMGITYAQGDADAHESRFDDVACAIH